MIPSLLLVLSAVFAFGAITRASYRRDRSHRPPSSGLYNRSR